MRYMKFVRVLFCLVLIFCSGDIAFSQVTKAGTSAAAFLRIPVGVRASAMGSAFVAVSDDASSMFWNPGGLARVEDISLMVDYSPWLPGVDFSYFGIVIPVESFGTVGLNVTALTSDEIEVTTVQAPLGTGESFTANSFAVGVAYSRELTDRFSIGANFKLVNESILNSSATGFMLDVGTLYDTPFPGIRLGVSISNIGTSMKITGEDLNIRADIAPQQQGDNQSIVAQLTTDDFDAPIIMRVGLAWQAFTNEAGSLTLSADGLNPNDNAQSVNFGAEYSLFNRLLILRGGFNDVFLDERELGLTFGFGVNLTTANGIGFSGGYAYQDFETLDAVNRFSLELKF